MFEYLVLVQAMLGVDLRFAGASRSSGLKTLELPDALVLSSELPEALVQPSDSQRW